MVYWGISLNSGELPGGNTMINTLIGGLVEIPATVGLVVCLLYWGRRPALVISISLAGVSCIIAAFIPKATGRCYNVCCLTF